MHGIIHKSLKEYVNEKIESGAWDTVLDRAEIDPKLYLPVSYYPDEEVMDILEVLATITGHEESAIQRDFGSYLAPALLDTFKAHVKAGWGAMDTIAALDTLYQQLDAKNDTDVVTEIETERPDPDTVIVTYRSERGLALLAEGVVRGIASHFEEPIGISVIHHDTEDGEEVRRIRVSPQ